jgi:hypothetical protein
MTHLEDGEAVLVIEPRFAGSQTSTGQFGDDLAEEAAVRNLRGVGYPDHIVVQI